MNNQPILSPSGWKHPLYQPIRGGKKIGKPSHSRTKPEKK
jgi:hypothetical protein